MLQRMKEEAPPTVYLQSLFMYAIAMGEQGYYQAAIEILEAGRRHGLKAGEQYSTPKVTNSLGWAHHELCCFDKAIEYNNLALDSIQELLSPETSNLFEIESHTRINLGENYLMKGNFKKALEHLELVYANSLKSEYFFNLWRYKPRCLLGLGELWLQKGDLSKAQYYQDKLIDHGWTTKWPYKKYQVRSGRLQGNIYAAQGKFDEAQNELQQALKMAEQLGNPTQLWKTHQALGGLFFKQGKNDHASAKYLNTIKIVQGIAEKLTDPELKEGFLHSEPIREVFAQAGQLKDWAMMFATFHILYPPMSTSITVARPGSWLSYCRRPG
jgi:tetratricopeptide (TPR) repeat protein